MPRYVPNAGDVVWLNFTPQAGDQQAGHRPALVLGPATYNAKTSLMICCPMTTQIKNYPFEVVIAGTPPSGLADQVKSLDWRIRKATKKGVVTSDVAKADVDLQRNTSYAEAPLHQDANTRKKRNNPPCLNPLQY